MARPSDGGKGSDRRKENGDSYRHNHDRIDWSKKAPPAQPTRPIQQRQRWPFEVYSQDE